MSQHGMNPACRELCVTLMSLLFCGMSECFSGNNVFEKRSGSWFGTVQGMRSLLADLAEEIKGFLGKLAGEQTVVSVQKAFSQVFGIMAAGLASGVNVISDYLSHFLKAFGFAPLPFNRVTPEVVSYVAQWVLLALIGYWLISLAFCMVSSILRRALWLLKLGVALSLFGLILSDRSVGTETVAIRLAILLCLCVLLGIGPSAGSTVGDKTAHLEEQVRILERRVRDMERWRTED